MIFKSIVNKESKLHNINVQLFNEILEYFFLQGERFPVFGGSLQRGQNIPQTPTSRQSSGLQSEQ